MCPICAAKSEGRVSHDIYSHMKYRHTKSSSSSRKKILSLPLPLETSSPKAKATSIPIPIAMPSRSPSKKPEVIVRSPHSPILRQRIFRKLPSEDEYWDLILSLDAIPSKTSFGMRIRHSALLEAGNTSAEVTSLENVLESSESHFTNFPIPKCTECNQPFRIVDTCEIFSCQHVFHENCARKLGHMYQNSLCPHCFKS